MSCRPCDRSGFVPHLGRAPQAALGEAWRLPYVWFMWLLRRGLVLLTVFALVAGSLTVSSLAVMDAGLMDQAVMHADGGKEPMPGCTDCGRDAVPSNACAMHCVLPPADLAATIVLPMPPMAAPTASRFLIRAGRVPTPELHPPQAAA